MKIKRVNPDLSDLTPNSDPDDCLIFAAIFEDDGNLIGHVVVYNDGTSDFIITRPTTTTFSREDLWQLIELVSGASYAYQHALIKRSEEDIKAGRLIDHAQVEKELG